MRKVVDFCTVSRALFKNAQSSSGVAKIESRPILLSFVMFLSPSKCAYFPRWGAYFSSAPLKSDQVFERECFFSKGVFAGGDIPRGVLQKMGPLHFHRVLHCFFPARM